MSPCGYRPLCLRFRWSSPPLSKPGPSATFSSSVSPTGIGGVDSYPRLQSLQTPSAGPPTKLPDATPMRKIQPHSSNPRWCIFPERGRHALCRDGTIDDLVGKATSADTTHARTTPGAHQHPPSGAMSYVDVVGRTVEETAKVSEKSK